MVKWNFLNKVRSAFLLEIKTLMESRYIFAIFIALVVGRIILSFLGPFVTTDLARSLFYGKHFWHVFFDVYSLTPLEIDPNFDIIDPTTGLLAWPNNAYDYPIFSISFFAIFGLLPIELSTKIILVKLTYSGFDFINFILLRRIENEKIISWFYWVVMIPFTCIEGQPATITVFFFIAAIWLYKVYDSPTPAMIMVALGFHWKYVSLALLPYFIIDIFHKTLWNNWNDRNAWKSFLMPIIYFGIYFTILWFPVLVSPYALQYIGFGGNLPVQTLPWNPFYLGAPFSYSSYLLLVTIILLAGYTIFVIKKEEYQNKWWSLSNYIPLTGLLIFLLIYRYGFPWYWMWIVPMFTLVPHQKLQTRYFLIFIAICVVAAVEFIQLTIGFNGFFNFVFNEIL